MKTRIFFFSVFFILTVGTRAQKADQLMGKFINREDWFALDEEYPKVKDKIQSAVIKSLSEIMLGLHFNKPEQALLSIDSLLERYQEQAGFELVSNMVALKSMILGEQGNYAESADNMNDFLNQISAFTPRENFPTHIAIAEYFNEIRNEQKPLIIRPDKDTEVPMSIEKAVKGVLMFVPVTINGKTHRFIFDTGAGSTFVSERFAQEVGLRIVRDSITIIGVGTGTGKSGTIDSMIIGDIVFKHPIIAIAPSNPAIDSIYRVDAVLGLDFIRRVGETRIFPREEKIVFPKDQTALPKTGRNLYFQNGQSYLKAYSKNERLIFHFDTGNVTADLFVPYYLRNKKKVEKQGVEDTIKGGGFGGIKEVKGYRLPSFSLKIGTINVVLNNLAVTTDVTTNLQRQEDGSLGMDLIKMLREVIINYDKMFVEIKK